MPKPEIEGSCWLWWAILLLTVPLPWLFSVCLAGLVHEMGHYAAVRLLGGEIIAVSVGCSGIRMEASGLSTRQSIAASLAGPLAGLLPMFAVKWLPLTAFCGIIQSIRNLLPLGNTDGSHILKAVLSAFLGEVRADQVCRRVSGFLWGIILILSGIVLYRLNRLF